MKWNGKSVMAMGAIAIGAVMLSAGCASRVTTKPVIPNEPPPKNQAFVYNLSLPVIKVTETRRVAEDGLFKGEPISAKFEIVTYPDPSAQYSLQYDARWGSKDELKFTLANGALSSVNVVVEDRSLEAVGNLVKFAGSITSAAIKSVGAKETKDIELVYYIPLTKDNARGVGGNDGPYDKQGYVLGGWSMIVPMGEGAQTAPTKSDYVAYRPMGVYEVTLNYAYGGNATRPVKQYFTGPALGQVRYAGTATRAFVKRTWKMTFDPSRGLEQYDVDSGSPAEAGTKRLSEFPADFVSGMTSMLDLQKGLATKQAELEEELKKLKESKADKK
jgi:hypothetical protein